MVEQWNDNEYIGVGLIKYLKETIKVQCPILVLSIINDQIEKLISDKKNHIYILSKKGLLPSKLKSEIYRILGVAEK